MDNTTLTAEKLQSMLNKVKAASCSEPQIPIAYGTQKVLDEIKDLLPPDMPTQVLPDEVFPEDCKDNVYVIPLWSPDQLLKVAFREFEDWYEPDFRIIET